jgi:hypothetical protein
MVHNLMVRLDRTIYIDLSVMGNLKADIDLWVHFFVHLDQTAHHDISKGSGRPSGSCRYVGPVGIGNQRRYDGPYQSDGYSGYNIYIYRLFVQ